MAKYQTKICPHCKDEFYTNKSTKKYCSEKCMKSHVHLNTHPLKSKLRVVNCLQCGKTFSTSISKQIYCSKECGALLFKEKTLDSKQFTSFRLFERDNFTCIYCGKSSINDGVKLVMDHIYPRNMGGKNDIINMVTACVECNSHKRDSLLQQDIILDLWKRNQALMNKSDVVEQYDSLLSHLNYYYKESKGES